MTSPTDQPDSPRQPRRSFRDHREPCVNCLSQPVRVTRATAVCASEPDEDSDLLEMEEVSSGRHARVCPRCGYGGWYCETPEEADQKWDEYARNQKTMNQIEFLRAVLSGPLASPFGKTPEEIGAAAAEIALTDFETYQNSRAGSPAARRAKP